MYKYLALSLVILLSACSKIGFSFLEKNYTAHDYYIIEATNGFEIFYDEKASKNVREYYISGTIVINGSYFGANTGGLYYPAGYWEHPHNNCCMIYLEDGSSVSTTTNHTDPNLSHIVSLSETGVLEIFSPELFKQHAGTYKYGFQSGPLVLSGNILQTFSNSWHANSTHPRTLIGKTQSGKIYFFVFEKPISLKEVGKNILKDDRFMNDPIILLNLDGGPSTAYYDGKYGFRENEKLPIIFRIRIKE